MVIASIGDRALAYCDVAPIYGSTEYVTVTRGYPPSYIQRSDNIYRSGMMFENYTGYIQLAFFYMFDQYPTGFASGIAGSTRIYDGGNGYYIGYLESGANLGTFTDADIHFNGEIYHGWSFPTLLSMIGVPYTPPPVYTWSSVPAITGKNGSLSLPTLVDTDGEPISGQSASVFSSLPEGANVRALINGAL